MSEEIERKTFKCLPKVLPQKLCGIVLDMVPFAGNCEPYLSITRDDGKWEITGYLPEKDGMILGAAADLLYACEFALSILSRDGIAPLLGTAFTQTDLDVMAKAVAKARGET